MWERGQSLGSWLSGSKYLWSWKRCQAQCWVWQDKEAQDLASEAEFQTRRPGGGVDNAVGPGHREGGCSSVRWGGHRQLAIPREPQIPSQKGVVRALPPRSLPRLSPRTGVHLLNAKGLHLTCNQESSGAAAACPGPSPDPVSKTPFSLTLQGFNSSPTVAHLCHCDF